MTDDVEKQQKKADVRAYFAKVAPNYDTIGPRIFATLGEMLVERADVPRGADVLDIATGRGAQLFAAAEAVGPSGRVVGVDLSPEMVRETASEIARRGVDQAIVRQMDAEALEFPDASFDRVTCGFALFFFPSPERALEEFHRVLRPGGKVAASTWGDPDPLWAWYDEIAKRHGVPGVNVGSGRFRTPAELETVLAQAGFVEVRTQLESITFVYKDEEEWWNRVWAHEGAITFANVAPDVLGRFKADAFERLRAVKQPDGLHRLARVLFATAVKAQ
jgi:ubiquinone/menaquinone biosynthesis C-methylase UbiE